VRQTPLSASTGGSHATSDRHICRVGGHRSEPAGDGTASSDPKRRHRRRPEHGRLRQGLSRTDVREGASRCHRQGGRHRTEDFIALATSPKVQADGIVKRFNWYPGIDASAVKPQLDEASWSKLFVDVTPEDLAAKGKPFPIAPYFNDILESYERKVQ
jgi:hypothetical protein